MGNKLFKMGSKPNEKDKNPFMMEVSDKTAKLSIEPRLMNSEIRWIIKDLSSVYGVTPKYPRAIKPPDHYIEYMRLKGWLDLDLDDPDLAHLYK